MRIVMTGASNIGKAGVATIAFNLGQAMDCSRVQLDYLAQRGLENDEYRRMIETKNGHIFTADPYQGNKVGKMLYLVRWIKSVLAENHYDAIHINTDTAYLAAIYLWIAKKAGITKIIVHSHSTMVDDSNGFRRKIKTILHHLCKGYVRRNADLRLACSGLAGRWMFNNDSVTVIPNGIDLEKFRFDPDIRQKKRRELGIEDKFVIGCVGRLAYQKNYVFSIQILQEILKQRENAVLLAIGDGPERRKIETYIREHNLSDQCILLGNRTDVNEWLSAMDVFLLPSRFEGLGIVYIEAQAAGLPTFASDAVPDEAFVTQLIHKLSLGASPEHWADLIVNQNGGQRDQMVEQIEEKGYSIAAAARLLESTYLEALEG